MRRMLWAGLMALPMLLASADVAKAQGCGSCGPFVGGGRPAGWTGGGGSPFGCGGFCLRLFGATLQEGPLVNYGPYEGYYPFAPYGPWTSDGRYTGPSQRFPAGTAGGCGLGGCGGLGLLAHKKEKAAYALSTFRNVFQRCQPCGKGCGF